MCSMKIYAPPRQRLPYPLLRPQSRPRGAPFAEGTCPAPDAAFPYSPSACGAHKPLSHHYLQGDRPRACLLYCVACRCFTL